MADEDGTSHPSSDFDEEDPECSEYPEGRCLVPHESLPFILQLHFSNVLSDDKTWFADCNYCVSKKQKRDKRGSSSNFRSHLKVQHPEAFCQLIELEKANGFRKKSGHHISTASCNENRLPTLFDRHLTETSRETSEGDEKASESNDSAVDRKFLVPVESLPHILQACFSNVQSDSKTWYADCDYCIVKKQKREKRGGRSNFVRHVKHVHPEHFAEFLKLGREGKDDRKKLSTPRVNSSCLPILEEPETTTLPEIDEIESPEMEESTGSYPVLCPVDSPPLILQICFSNVLSDGRKWFADCNYCVVNKQKRDNKGISSNFVRHVKHVHPDNFAEFLELEMERKDELKNRSTPRLKRSYSAMLEEPETTTLPEIEEIESPETEESTENYPVLLPVDSPPLILQVCFSNVLSDGKTWYADCNYCVSRKQKRDKRGITSNFRYHVKTLHSEEFAVFLDMEKEKKIGKTKSISATTSVSSEYLNAKVIRHLIIGMNLPPSMVEHQQFIQFVHDCIDPHWTGMSRKSITDDIFPSMVKNLEEKMISVFRDLDNVGCLLNVWIDRRGCLFLEITAQICNRKFEIQKLTLGVKRLQGHDTAALIAEEFKAYVGKFGIAKKIGFVVVDNEASSISGMNLSLPSFVSSEAESEDNPFRTLRGTENESSPSDEPENGCDLRYFESVNPEFHIALEDVFSEGEYRRLPCFDKALHDIVEDGLKMAGKMPVLVNLLAKVRQIVINTYNAKEVAETMAEVGCTIHESSDTCWSSQMKILRGMLTLGREKLNSILDNLQKRDLKLQKSEFNILLTFLEALHLFEIATDQTQANSGATIGCVAPLIAGIHAELSSFYDADGNSEGDDETEEEFVRDPAVAPFVDELLSSLRKRFSGLLSILGFSDFEGMDSEPGFRNDVYLVAAFLDPAYRDLWVDVFIPLENRAELKKKIRNAVEREALSLSELHSPTTSAQNSIITSPAAKKPKLFEQMFSSKLRQPSDRGSFTIQDEIVDYMDDPKVDREKIWTHSKRANFKLREVAQRLFAIPVASSSFQSLVSERSDWITNLISQKAENNFELRTFLKSNFHLVEEPMLSSNISLD